MDKIFLYYGLIIFIIIVLNIIMFIKMIELYANDDINSDNISMLTKVVTNLSHSPSNVDTADIDILEKSVAQNKSNYDAVLKKILELEGKLPSSKISYETAINAMGFETTDPINTKLNDMSDDDLKSILDQLDIPRPINDEDDHEHIVQIIIDHLLELKKTDKIYQDTINVLKLDSDDALTKKLDQMTDPQLISIIESLNIDMPTTPDHTGLVQIIIDYLLALKDTDENNDTPMTYVNGKLNTIIPVNVIIPVDVFKYTTRDTFYDKLDEMIKSGWMPCDGNTYMVDKNKPNTVYYIDNNGNMASLFNGSISNFKTYNMYGYGEFTSATRLYDKKQTEDKFTTENKTYTKLVMPEFGDKYIVGSNFKKMFTGEKMESQDITLEQSTKSALHPEVETVPYNMIRNVGTLGYGTGTRTDQSNKATKEFSPGQPANRHDSNFTQGFDNEFYRIDFKTPLFIPRRCLYFTKIF